MHISDTYVNIAHRFDMSPIFRDTDGVSSSSCSDKETRPSCVNPTQEPRMDEIIYPYENGSSSEWSVEKVLEVIEEKPRRMLFRRHGG